MTDLNRSEHTLDHAAAPPYREDAVRRAATRPAPPEEMPHAIPVWLGIAFWLLALPILLGIAAAAIYGFRMPPLTGAGP